MFNRMNQTVRILVWFAIFFSLCAGGYSVFAAEDINSSGLTNEAGRNASNLQKNKKVATNGVVSVPPVSKEMLSTQSEIYSDKSTTEPAQEMSTSIQPKITNYPPTLDHIGPKTVKEGQTLTFTVTGSDPDGDPLLIIATGLPEGASFENQKFSWNPTLSQAGHYFVSFRAFDGHLIYKEKIAITVLNQNRLPAIKPIEDKIVDEGESIDFNLEATDEDDDSLTVTAENLPQSASFNENAFHWTPSFSQSGTYSIAFKASDGTDTVDRTVSITVNNVNRAPELATIGNKSILQGRKLSFQVMAIDPDQDPIQITASDLPSGAEFQNNAFSWIPTDTQVGKYEVVFTVSDGSLSDEQKITVSVEKVNRPPQIVPIGSKTIERGRLLTFSIDASDPDGTPLSLSAANLPKGAEFIDGTFTWTPTAQQVGNYEVTFNVTDGSLRNEQIVPISVVKVSRPPVVQKLDDQIINEGAELTFKIETSDPNGDPVIINISNLPNGATLKGDRFDWTPTFSQSGVYDFVVTASNGEMTTEFPLKITVKDVNQPPQIVPIGNKSVAEGVNIAFKVSTFDADSDLVTIRAENMPEGAVFSNGTFSWTPNLNQSAIYYPKFVALDQLNQSEQVVKIDVENVNQPPAIEHVGDQTVDENQPLIFKVITLDPDKDLITLSHSDLPKGATFKDSEFNWTPTFLQAGNYKITFQASDASLAVSETIKIDVRNVNAPPHIAEIGNQSVDEGKALTFDVSAEDLDSDPVTLTAKDLPEGAAFTDNQFSWTPLFTQAGEYNVRFIATDQALSYEQKAHIVVNDVNRKPVMEVIPDQSVQEGVELTFTVGAIDPDRDKIKITAANLPEGASYSDGLFAWMPSYSQAGDYAVKFLVSDGFLTDEQTAKISVSQVDRPPVMAPIDPKTVKEASELSFAVSATDPDQDQVTITSENYPPGAKFVGNQFSWTPNYEQAGTYDVKFSVSDGTLSDEKFVSITVLNVNLPPSIGSIGNKTTHENEELKFTVVASDPDSDKVTISEEGLPEGATFIDSQFVWTPSFTQAGSYQVTFEATDGSLTDQSTVSIDVADVGRPPKLNPIEDQKVDEGSVLNFEVTAMDPDVDQIQIDADSLPEGAVFNDGEFHWAPNYQQAGSYNVSFLVSDGTLSDKKTVKINVINANRSPHLPSLKNIKSFEAEPIQFTVTADDPDNDPLTITASGLPEGANFGKNKFEWTPNFKQAGTYKIIFKVTDQMSTAEETALIDVMNVNQAPTLDVINKQTIDEGSELSFLVTATDLDLDPVVIKAFGVPDGAVFNDNKFSWTPSFKQAGRHDVTFVASDGNLVTEKMVTINVNNVNGVPSFETIQDKTIAEGEELLFEVNAKDPDSEPLLVSCSALPKGAIFDGNTFFWRPGFSDAGIYKVIFTANDGNATIEQTINVSVTNVNQAPAITPVGAKSIAEGEKLEFAVTVSDPDSDKVILVATGLPEGAAFNGNTFTWTPTFTQEGSYDVIFAASDGVLTVEDAATIVVSNLNRAPVLDVVKSQNVTESEPIHFTVSAKDPDFDLITVNAQDLPMGATFSKGSFDWTPTFKQAGEYRLVFTATDGVDTNEKTVMVHVANKNRPPVIDDIPPKSVKEEKTLQFPIVISDPDEDKLIVTADGLPEGAIFIDNQFSWTPTYSQVGVYDVKFSASDKFSQDTKTVTISVLDVNRAPELAAIGNKSIEEGAELSFTTSATDPDHEVILITASQLPEGAVFNNNEFHWTPSFSEAGSYKVKFKAFDGFLSDEETIVVDVANVNRAPKLNSISDQNVDEGAELNFQVTGTDPDMDATIIASGLPQGALFSGNEFYWSPGYNQAGVYDVTFTMSDGVLTDKQSMKINVANVSRKPILNHLGYKGIEEGSRLEFMVTAYNPDGDSITITYSELPPGATFIGNEFSWTPSYKQAGDYSVTFTATSGSASVEETVPIVVSNTNQPPVLKPIGNKVIDSKKISFNIQATDEDGDPVTITAKGVPKGALFEDSKFSWIISEKDLPGNYDVRFKAMDGSLSDEEVVTLTLPSETEIINRPPTLEPIGDKVVKEGDALSFDVKATDPEGKPFIVRLTGKPETAHFENGKFTWPSASPPGTYNILFQASDGGLTDEEVVTIKVQKVNHPPRLEPIEEKTINEGDVLDFKVSASDPDLELVTINADGLPKDATLEHGVFHWMPSYSQAGTYEVIFKASDGSLIAEQPVKIQVNNVNRAPILSTSNQNGSEAEAMTFTVNAADPDEEPVEVTATDLPEGATFVNRVFRWAPSFDQGGSYDVVFQASDGNLSAKQTVTIHVANVNRSPILTPIRNHIVNEGEELLFLVTASDPDSDPVTLTAVGLPEGATFEKGTFRWTPSYSQAGSYDIIFTASDSLLTDQGTVTIQVDNVNSPPLLSIGDVKKVEEGELLTIKVAASDLDLQPVTITTSTLPEGATFSQNTFSWKPSYSQSGTYQITFKASDGVAITEKNVNITVVDKDRLPVIEPVAKKIVNEGELIHFVLTVNDPDQNIVTIKPDKLPSGATFEDSAFNWTPTFKQAGDYEIPFTISSGIATIHYSVNIRISDVNRAPSISAIEDRVVRENEALEFEVLATDLDSDFLTLTATGLPEGATFIGHQFSWTPTFSQAGNYEVGFIASDGLLSVGKHMKISVQDMFDEKIAKPKILSFSENHDGTGRITYSRLSDTAVYRLQIAQDVDFKKIIFENESTKLTQEFPKKGKETLLNGSYFARVNASAARESKLPLVSLWSEVIPFQVVLFHELKPELRITELIKNEQVNLTWGRLLNATSYEIEESAHSDFLSVNRSFVTALNSYDLNINANSDGTYYYRIRGIGTGGHSQFSQYSAVPSVKIDRTGPAVHIVWPQNGQVFNKTSIDVKYEVDGVSKSSFETLIEGDNKIIRSAQDNAGNETSDEVKVLLDTQSPTGSIMINDGEAITGKTEVRLGIQAEDGQSSSGVAQMELSNDGLNFEAPQPFSNIKTWNVPTSDGLKTVYVRLIDAAGNKSAVLSAQITLDQTPPIVNVSEPLSKEHLKTDNCEVKGTFSDAGSGIKDVEVLVNGNGPMPITINKDSFNAALKLKKGRNTITVKATDAVDNEQTILINDIALGAVEETVEHPH